MHAERRLLNKARKKADLLVDLLVTCSRLPTMSDFQLFNSKQEPIKLVKLGRVAEKSGIYFVYERTVSSILVQGGKCPQL